MSEESEEESDLPTDSVFIQAFPVAEPDLTSNNN